MKLVNVQVIKDELERLIRNYRFYSNTEAKYRYEAYKELSEWLDGLEVEEPSNDLEEAATKYARKQVANPDYPTYNDEYEMECAFEAGAQWQKKQLIDKAIKWLEDNIDRYLYNTGGYGEYIPKCGGKMFEDFKKAVEERLKERKK